MGEFNSHAAVLHLSWDIIRRKTFKKRSHKTDSKVARDRMKLDLGKYYIQCRSVRKSEKIYIGQMQIINMVTFSFEKSEILLSYSL